MLMLTHRILFAVLCLFLLSGCAAGDSTKETPEQSDEHGVSGGQLKKVPTKGPPPGWLLKDALSQEEVENQLRQNQEQQRERQNDPRLKEAAQLKNWSQVEVPGYGIQFWLKTRWVNGEMQMRIAALAGEKQQLSTFMANVKQFTLDMQDANTSTVAEWTVNPADFQWAPPSVNYGNPTMFFETSTQVPLEEYETYSFWNYTWAFGS